MIFSFFMWHTLLKGWGSGARGSPVPFDVAHRLIGTGVV